MVSTVRVFLSHLTKTQEQILFDTLRMVLTPSGRFLILDSAWSAERATVNTKAGRQNRQLNDGTTFEVYKRYCDRADIAGWSKKYSVDLQVEHFGTAFYAVSGSFSSS